MAKELAEQRKAGRRFCLALVDPLLQKPAYFELRKPEVTVGFLPGCDWVLPWSSMGIDVITASRRSDGSEMGKLAKEPFFNMKYDSQKGWSAECAAGYWCRVLPCTPSHVYVWRMIWEGAGKDNPQTVLAMENGSAFVFSWALVDLLDKRSLSSGFPHQDLRFVFVECNRDELAERHYLNAGPKQLLSLPKEVLAKLASYSDPKGLLSTLCVVGRVFASPLMRGQIPWKKLELSSSFDSLRIAELAAAETVERVKCGLVKNPVMKGNFYGKWKRVIYHDNLKVLEIQDPDLLRMVGVPPRLEELRIRIVAPRADFWQSLKVLVFPASVRRVCIRSYIREGVDTLSPEWLFSAFSGLEELQVLDVSCESNWARVPAESLKKLTALHDRDSLLPFKQTVPYHLMSNLKFLRFEGFDSPEYVNGCLRLPSLVHLYLDGESCDCRFVDDAGRRLIDAPNLRSLRVVEDFADVLDESRCKSFEAFPSLFPLLEDFEVDSLNINPRVIVDMLRKLPKLKNAVVFGEIEEADFFDTNPEIAGVTCDCSWELYPGLAKYEFHFPEEEVTAPLDLDPFDWCIFSMDWC